VTYNFDPDRWYEDERARIELWRRSGRLTEVQAQDALAEADRRYEAMLARLDQTYTLFDENHGK